MYKLNTILTKEQVGLKAYVKNTVVLQSEPAGSQLHRFRFFADGLPGIIFQQSNQPMFLNQSEKRLPDLFLYGQTVKPIEISAPESYKMILIFLYPHVIKSLVGVEASELTDTCIDLNSLPVKGVNRLKQQLAATISTEDQKDMLLSFLSELIQRNCIYPEREVHYITDSLIRTGGNLPLRNLQDELNMSERTFERKFLHHVGVSPRLFARICRFNSALSQLKAGNHHKLTDIAYDNGFADQSHLGRTFKEFTGLTPTEYLVNYQLAFENF